ncbi:hypothetical protein MNBD_GAMMA23-777, partial [hydrothermal vent metagenome]
LADTKLFNFENLKTADIDNEEGLFEFTASYKVESNFSIPVK